MADGLDEDDLFVPLRPLLRSLSADRANGKGQGRERALAQHVGRHREHGRQPPRPARGLSRADIVATAIAVADAEGADAVSMRRVARALGVGAMSLYWHVESKEELQELMLERVHAEGEAPEPTGHWQADLRAYARNMRSALLRHPWAIDYLGTGPPSGPVDARNADRLLAALDGLGLDPLVIMWTAMTISTYVIGAALREVQEIRWERTADEAWASMPEEKIDEILGQFHRLVRESGRFPHLTAALDSGIDPDARETRDERFEFGLGCVLDGIAVRIKTGR